MQVGSEAILGVIKDFNRWKPVIAQQTVENNDLVYICCKDTK